MPHHELDDGQKPHQERHPVRACDDAQNQQSEREPVQPSRTVSRKLLAMRSLLFPPILPHTTSAEAFVSQRRAFYELGTRK